MALHHKIYRSIIHYKNQCGSLFRILHYKLKYPSLQIDFKSFLSPNCNIVCVDGAFCSIKNCHFGQGVYLVIEKGATLKISESYIGPNSVIVAKDFIEIKSHCSIAEMVVIRDQNHQFGNNQLIKNSGYTTGKINIEENVWIGAKATILKNVSIGKNSVIGAHSLVNKSFDENSIIAGAPAKSIKK